MPLRQAGITHANNESKLIDIVEVLLGKTVYPYNRMSSHTELTDLLYLMINQCKRCGIHALGSLNKGHLAFVVNEDNMAQALFALPQISDASLFAWLEAGEVVQLLQGPHSHRSMDLWKIKSFKSNFVGWTSAGIDAKNFMLPLLFRRLCESALPSRLQIGDIAGIDDHYLRPICLLYKPIPVNCGGMPIGTLYGSSRLTIIDGPVCYEDAGNGQIFWQICSDTGQEGWVSECDRESYQLKPLIVQCKGYGCRHLSDSVQNRSGRHS